MFVQIEIIENNCKSLCSDLNLLEYLPVQGILKQGPVPIVGPEHGGP